MDYLKIACKTNTENVEILLALLGNLPFESFEEKENGLDAFLPEAKFSEAVEAQILEVRQVVDFSFEKIKIKSQNWNAVWEANFQPILIHNFCGIRADFHEPLEQVQHEIIINPKMAFGTGHHATTWMMVDAMSKIDFQGKKVFDFGCGTGILAILAAQLGAASVDALDIELPSYENTIENAQINQVENIEAIHGTIAKMVGKTYDIILANINRYVILDSLSTLNKMLQPSGILLISGILKEDEKLVKKEANRHGFDIIKTSHKNQWICLDSRWLDDGRQTVEQ